MFKAIYFTDLEELHIIRDNKKIELLVDLQEAKLLSEIFDFKFEKDTFLN